ncbi:MAG TPA: hypothetical protein VK524_27040 [Polyangiaceae bacterium]|nr:hypothetical protein [Polyangiaceae bacterium]
MNVLRASCVGLVGVLAVSACKTAPSSSETKPAAEVASAAPVPTASIAPAAPSAAAPESDEQAEKVALDTTIAFLKGANADKARFRLKDIVQYDENTDPNKLLGRPGQYLVKMNWKAAGQDATLEVFRSAEDAKKRADYVDAIGKSSPMFLQYVYLNEERRAVLRLPKELTPTQAKEWQTLFVEL